jgi:hypothetical protein
VAQRILRPLTVRLPRVAATLMITAGLITLGYKVVPLVQAHTRGPGSVAGEETMSCHHHHPSQAASPGSSPSSQ